MPWHTRDDWPHLYLELTVQFLDDCHCPARFLNLGEGPLQTPAVSERQTGGSYDACSAPYRQRHTAT